MLRILAVASLSLALISPAGGYSGGCRIAANTVDGGSTRSASDALIDETGAVPPGKVAPAGRAIDVAAVVVAKEPAAAHCGEAPAPAE
jgi:hypothetical protein